jgi:hypothetical protein
MSRQDRLASDAQAEQFRNPKCYDCKDPKKKKKKKKEPQCREIEPKLLKDRVVHEGDNPSF